MSSATESWGGKNAPRNIALVIGAVLIIAVLAVGSVWVLKDDYQTLFADMDARDAAAVVAELENRKIPYKVADDGARLLVPADAVHELRLKMLGGSVPISQGVGYELFDNSDFGMTEFAQRINYQRALEGELARTISAMSEVKYARVHLVLPESGLFKKDARAPSGAITLFLKDGASLSSAKVQSIQGLVSASVPELAAANVTVVDQLGQTLSKARLADPESATVSARLDQRREVEADLVAKILQVLEPRFGRGGVFASVNVTLNLDKVKTTSEEVLNAGDKGQVVRERTSKQASKRSSKSPESVTTEVEYVHGRRIEQVVNSPGGVERISVGLVVPLSTSPEEIDQIRVLVSAAVGTDAARGDKISIHPGVQWPEWTSQKQGVVPATPFPDINDSAPITSAADHVDATSSIASAQSGVDEQITWVKENLLAVSAAVGLIVTLVILLFVYSLLRRRSNQPKRLSVDERDELLKRLHGWLEVSEPASITQGRE